MAKGVAAAAIIRMLDDIGMNENGAVRPDFRCQRCGQRLPAIGVGERLPVLHDIGLALHAGPSETHVAALHGYLQPLDGECLKCGQAQ